jgi:YVTN family beta-propeller protein
VSELRFRLLGPLEAERDGTRLDLGPRKQRAVLALLLLEANRVVPTERLIDELWGDAPPETARSALQVYVAGLRKALGEDGASLLTRSPGYMLQVGPRAVDVQVFAELRAKARDASDPAGTAAALHEALALWRGEPLAELDGAPHGAAAAAQLEEQRLGALEERIDADLALGRHADLVHELDALVAEHPYRERFRAQQMLAFYRSGRQADALTAYRSAREAFVDGLGLEPGAELKALERAVLDQDPALDAPPQPAAATESPPRKRRVWIAAAALLALAAAAATSVFPLRGETPMTVKPNWVAIIDPEANKVVGSVQAGIRPGPITEGAGSVWAANLDDENLTKIDTASRTVAGTISLGAMPTGVAFGFGHVWVAHGLTGRVTRIDPELGGERSYDDVARTRKRSAVAAVAAGETWVWAVFGDGTLARIDPAAPEKSGAVEKGDTGARPTAVVEGGGLVWVVSSGKSRVYYYNPPTFLAQPIDRLNVGSGPTAIAYGYNAVWVSSSGDDLVTRIDPGSNSRRDIPVGDQPAAIAVGAGAVWAANRGDGTVSRIDPATRKVVETIDVGNAPSGIVVADGLIWVTVQAP